MENGHLKALLVHLQGVHTALYESIISSTRENRDTIIRSEVSPLSVQCELKSTRCQVQWHSCSPSALVSSHGEVGTVNQGGLEITVFPLHNYKTPA